MLIINKPSGKSCGTEKNRIYEIPKADNSNNCQIPPIVVGIIKITGRLSFILLIVKLLLVIKIFIKRFFKVSNMLIN